MADVIFVHGAWHGPWCWDEVAADLDKRGHNTTKVTLPGHNQPGSTSRIWKTIGAYVGAVNEALSGANEPAVLVGHSMGGYVVQRCLEHVDAAGAILIASVPSRGASRANLRAIRARPKAALLAALTGDYSHSIRSDQLVREQFFTATTPEEVIADCRRQLQNESAIALATMSFRRPKPQRVNTPVAVIAAKEDAIFTVDEQRRLAAAYDVEPIILDGGHDLMLDTTWSRLADAIDTILRTHTASPNPTTSDPDPY